MSRNKLANHIKQLQLSSHEIETIVGCLLGDGTLSKSGKNYRLRIEHNSRYREYVSWKYQLLQRLCASEIQYVFHHYSLRFGTVGHPEIANLRKHWYIPIKQIPSDVELTPLMIAIWFMDDGTKHRDTVDISIHNFSEESVEILCQELLKFGIQTTVNSDGKGKRLYVLKESYGNFKRLVKPYIVKCMAYKLP